MILMDDKGHKIHASVRKTLIYRFQSLLSEGRVYQISFFGVGESGRDFRPTSHPWKINFDIHTSVRLVPNKAINLSPYSFVPLSDIISKDLDTSFLIDVIEIPTGATGEQEFEKDGEKHKRITIQLDQDGDRVECAFFGKYVAEIVGYLASGDATNTVVVVQCAKIKPFKGKTSLQNVYGATKVLFNPLIQEAAPLRARFLESNDTAAQVISPLQDSAKKSTPEDDFLKLSDGKTIEQLKDFGEKKSYCVVLGTVKYIAEGMDWYYPACKYELNYNMDEMVKIHDELVSSLTSEQEIVYKNVLDVVLSDNGGFFFLYGFGGTGKTFVWNTLSATLRSRGLIILNVASSGIASLLLPGGRTAHSTFSIPISINEISTCNLRQGSPKAELLKKASLII
ncbi:uncharacterized protein LOC130713294 [Lotus japonicus]|uniref:uncharacterized protein LOC130713294 n=1 Tax=Lotus japonicus TaxID=34305 RepID=UPI002586A4D1|nr:uncharacterized protein LOC130713294 [Lotus japonicus]